MTPFFATKTSALPIVVKTGVRAGAGESKAKSRESLEK